MSDRDISDELELKNGKGDEILQAIDCDPRIVCQRCSGSGLVVHNTSSSYVGPGPLSEEHYQRYVELKCALCDGKGLVEP